MSACHADDDYKEEINWKMDTGMLINDNVTLVHGGLVA